MTETQLVPVEDIKAIVSSAPAALEFSIKIADKAETKAQGLIDTAEVEGMSDELDAAMNQVLADADAALVLMSSKRSPTTKIFDNIKSMFTFNEKRVDRKNEKSKFFEIAKLRNDYALVKLKEKQAEEQRIYKEQQKKLNEIQCEKDVNRMLNEWFIAGVSATKNFLLDILNKSSIDTIDEKEKKVKDFALAFDINKYDAKEVQASYQFLNIGEVAVIAVRVKAELLKGFQDKYTDEISVYRNEILDKFSGKRRELTEIANANAAEAKRLQAESEKKAADEKLRIANEAAANLQQAEQVAELTAESQSSEATFSAMAEIDNASSGPAKGRTGVKIEILAPNAIPLIFQLWWQNEGKNLGVDQLKKKTVAQMISFCEKYALINDKEQINAPKLMTYVDEYKTKVVK